LLQIKPRSFSIDFEVARYNGYQLFLQTGKAVWGQLEAVIRENKRGSAREIYEAVKADVLAFSPPADDISLVVLKRR